MPVDVQAMINRVLGGRYRVVRAIGSGGMGAVFEAEQLDLRRRVAIKLLTDVDEQSVARLRQEAMTAGSLHSPHVVAIFDFQANPDEPPFLVMELLAGEPLSQLLRREGALEAGRAVRIAVQMLTGLEAAHQAGITHRDIKPSNVWIARSATGDEHVKLLDFGIAKHHDVPSSVQTDAGQLLGTPGYLAPEQLRGQRADARSDVHAVGIVLFEMLSGARPWKTTSAMETIQWVPPPVHLHAPSTPLPVSAAVSRALAKDPHARFPSASDMARTLLAAFPPSGSFLPAGAQAGSIAGLAASAAPPTETFDVAGRRGGTTLGSASLPSGLHSGRHTGPPSHPLSGHLSGHHHSGPQSPPSTLGGMVPGPGIPPPRRSRTGLVVGIVLGGLALLVCGLGAVLLLVTHALDHEGPAATNGAPRGPRPAAAPPPAPSVAVLDQPAPTPTPTPLPAPAAKPSPRGSAKPAAPVTPPAVVPPVVPPGVTPPSPPPPAPQPPPPAPPTPGPAAPRPAKLEASADLAIYDDHEQSLFRGAASRIDACVRSSTGHVENEQIVVYVRNGGGRPPTFEVGVSGAEVSSNFLPCVGGVMGGLGLRGRDQKTRLRIYYRL